MWMQLGVRNDEAAKIAEDAGLKVVMNRCPKIEYGRLSGEIGWVGVNRRVIDNRKPFLFSKGGTMKHRVQSCRHLRGDCLCLLLASHSDRHVQSRSTRYPPSC